MDNNIHNQQEREKLINRRTMLRSAGSAGGVFALGSSASGAVTADPDCGISDSDADFSNIDYEWQSRDSDFEEGLDRDMQGATYYQIEISAGLIYVASEYESRNQQYRWNHYFLSAAHVASALRSGDLSENIRSQTISIENLDPNSAALFVSQHPEYMGAYPASDGVDLNYGDAAFTVLLGVISLAGKTITVGTTAVGATVALLDTDEPDHGEVSWNYLGEEPCEAAHFADFHLRSVEGSTEAQVSVENAACQRHGDECVSVTRNASVDVSPPGVEPTDASHAQVGTQQYLDYLESSDYYKEIDRSESFGNRKKNQKSHDGPIYRALNPTVKILEE